MKFRRPLLLLLLLTFLSACSTRFLYNQLDRLIVWRVGGFVTLSSEQKADFRGDLGSYLERVRAEELPRLADEIRQVSQRLSVNEFSAESIEATYQRVMTETDNLMTGIVPLSADMLMQLDAEQKQELFENLTELNDEMFETYSGETPEERRENRNKSAIKGIQGFSGRLSKEQKALVDDSLASMDDASEDWIAYQRTWQQQFFSLLDENPPRDKYEERLTELIVYPRNLHSAEYRRRVDGNRRIMSQMTAELLDGLSETQRRKAVAKLDGYVETLTRLAKSR